MRIRCLECKYWKERTSNSPIGKCRRYPKYIKRHWVDWCGEAELKEKQE
jgi:hypothetical protein